MWGLIAYLWQFEPKFIVSGFLLCSVPMLSMEILQLLLSVFKRLESETQNTNKSLNLWLPMSSLIWCVWCKLCNVRWYLSSGIYHKLDFLPGETFIIHILLIWFTMKIKHISAQLELELVLSMGIYFQFSTPKISFLGCLEEP